jgi:thioredoxin-dependent peroxiredoxin
MAVLFRPKDLGERHDFATFDGKPIVLLGDEIEVGNKVDDFSIYDANLNMIKLSNFNHKVKVFISIPSVDMPSCIEDILNIAKLTEKYSENIQFIFISMDLPFTIKRFNKEKKISSILFYSDNAEKQFGAAFGILVKKLGLLSKAIFLLGRDNKLNYVEYVRELTDSPHINRLEKAIDAIIEQDI